MYLLTMHEHGVLLTLDDVSMVTEELPTLWRGYNCTSSSHSRLASVCIKLWQLDRSWRVDGEWSWWWHYLSSPPFPESLKHSHKKESCFHFHYPVNHLWFADQKYCFSILHTTSVHHSFIWDGHTVTLT